MNTINVMIPLKLLISTLFLVMCFMHKLANIVCSNSQTVFTSDNDLKYMIDDSTNSQLSSVIRFTPESLDFHHHSIGIPYIERVLVENIQNDESIQMLSISGNTVHFHCSFFEDKIISAGGNTTFEVVFLARHEGPVNNTLYIHTSLGSFKYRVSAIGVSNPFRLRPFIGAKVPINSSYAPLIHIYNPHLSTLQLTEMYTTGGGLHLELPTGDSEGNKDIWQIAPFETKTIMRANFLARSEKNHTAYIRIKTNSSDQDFVILPVEVEVSSAPGIYSPIDLIDFGVMRSDDEPKTIAIQILNSGSKLIQIQNVIATPVNDALHIEFNSPVKVSPNIYHAIDIARVTFFPKKISHCSKQCVGKIVVKSKNNQYKLAIPYRVELLQGSLSYNESKTQFYIESSNSFAETRTLIINNKFNTTVVLHSVSLPDDAKPYFKVVLLSKTITLTADAIEPAIKITFTPSSQLSYLETNFRLHTNLSFFNIPLLAYSGKLDMFIPLSINQSVLDFGAIGLGEKKSMTFAVINNNPVIVRLKHWGCNMSKASVELMGIDKGNVSLIAHKLDLSTLNKKQISVLKPKYFAVFQLHLTGFSEEGIYYGENFVETAYEKLKIPFVLRVVEGSFSLEKISIGNCFPGRISSQTVRITSYFTPTLKFKSVLISPEDERFLFELNNSLVNYGENFIGKLYFDHIKSCGKTCYTGLDTSKEVGHLWLLGISLHPDTGYIDKELHKLLYSRWINLQESDKNINVTLQMQIDGVSPVLIGANAVLQWPRLVNKNSVKFPITRIGNTTVKDIIIENPSSQQLLVQLVLLSDYPNPEAILQLLKSGFHAQWSDSEINALETKPKSFYLTNITSEDVLSSHKFIRDSIGVNPDPNSITMIMPIGSRKKISISLTPQDDSALISTMLLIRNNLTIIDAIHLQGQGGNGALKIGNQLPGLKSVLSFELLEKHLKSCSKTKNSQMSSTSNSYSIEPTFTVHRTFTAVNVGKLSMKIKGFTIGPQTGNTFSCQGYGFKVINCGAFDLRPNENRKIHIAFTPDFTQHKTKHILTIHTDNLNEKIQYALVATLPKHLLPYCNASLPRPQWEIVVYYCLVTMIIFIMLLSVCAALYDGDRILNYTFYPVFTTYSFPHFENNCAILSTPEDTTDKLFSKLPANCEDLKDTNKKYDLRQRKVKSNTKDRRSGTTNTREDLNCEMNGSVYQSHSWTQLPQFLRKKLVRRDSSGSDKSNNSARNLLMSNITKAQSIQQMSEISKKDSLNNNNNNNNDRLNNSIKMKKKNQKIESTDSNKSANKKLNSSSFEHKNLTNVISSPPPPLPTFPSASTFDEESFVKNMKTSKKSRANSFHNDSVVSNVSVELPYKPKPSNLSAKTAKKKQKDEHILDDNESYTSSNENSIIWDAPITTFDTDNAMNELVRQTEIFAEKSLSSSKKSKLNAFTSNPKMKTETPSTTASYGQMRDSLLPSNWNPLRSSTPPAITNHCLDEVISDRRTPPTKFPQAIERPVSSNPWLTDLNTVNGSNSLDHELTHLRETSSPWNSQNNSTQISRQRDWNSYTDYEPSKDVWNSKWNSTATSTLTSKPSQSLWNDSFNQNLWTSKDTSNTWGEFPTFRNDAQTSLHEKNLLSSGPNVDSSFNLFGSSLWSPLSPSATNTNTANPKLLVTTTVTTTTSTATTWSFTPFSLFGSSQTVPSTQYTNNNINNVSNNEQN